MLYKGDTLYLDWLEDGIAELVFDAPGSVNKLDTATVASLGHALDVLEKQNDLKGLMLRSEKAAFIVGADITEFLSLFLVPEEQLSQWLHFANSVFNRLEDLPVPTVSAVNGYALGGGCECVLATDYRLATPDLRIGLPETKLGIMPGFGGSVRLPRLLGADSALEIIGCRERCRCRSSAENRPGGWRSCCRQTARRRAGDPAPGDSGRPGLESETSTEAGAAEAQQN